MSTDLMSGKETKRGERQRLNLDSSWHRKVQGGEDSVSWSGSLKELIGAVLWPEFTCAVWLVFLFGLIFAGLLFLTLVDRTDSSYPWTKTSAAILSWYILRIIFGKCSTRLAEAYPRRKWLESEAEGARCDHSCGCFTLLLTIPAVIPIGVIFYVFYILGTNGVDNPLQEYVVFVYLVLLFSLT